MKNITLEKVIEHGKETNQLFGISVDNLIYVPIAFILSIAIVMFVLGLISKGKFVKDNDHILAFLVLISTVLVTYYSGKELKSKTTEWENEYVFPYIESLESEEYEIVSIDLEEEREFNESSGVTNKDKDSQLFFATITYKDEDSTVKSLEGNVEVILDLENGETDYMEYKHPKDSLKNYGYNKPYNIKVHLSNLDLQ